MGEDRGDAASRLAALREVRKKMMTIAMIIVVMIVIVVMMVGLAIMEMVIVDCGSSQGVEDGIQSGF